MSRMEAPYLLWRLSLMDARHHHESVQALQPHKVPPKFSENSVYLFQIYCKLKGY